MSSLHHFMSYFGDSKVIVMNWQSFAGTVVSLAVCSRDGEQQTYTRHSVQAQHQ